MPGGTATLRIEASAGGLATLYSWLETSAAALPAGRRYAMQVALEEAARNAAMHALHGHHDAFIDIRYRACGVPAVLVIEDSGPEFDVAGAARAAVRPPPGTVGGRGLVLLRHFCPDIRYARTAGRNRLTLRFPAEGGTI